MADDYRPLPPQLERNARSETDGRGAALKFRTIWLSDIHLGTRGCKAEILLDFLRHTESEYLYLVGDIVDGWHLKKRWYWPQTHNDVIQKFLRRARHGAKVFFVAGNHDEFARDFCGLYFGGILVADKIIHETVDGRRLLTMHGDQFDAVMGCAKWLAHLGDTAYDFALWLNTIFNFCRLKFGLPYWSLSAWLKHKVKNAVSYIGNFEQAVAWEAERRELDGMICGHIHHAEMRDIGAAVYCNCGDWVESCTALVEHHDGRLELLRWTNAYPETVIAPAVAVALAKAN